MVHEELQEIDLCFLFHLSGVHSVVVWIRNAPPRRGHLNTWYLDDGFAGGSVSLSGMLLELIAHLSSHSLPLCLWWTVWSLISPFPLPCRHLLLCFLATVDSWPTGIISQINSFSDLLLVTVFYHGNRKLTVCTLTSGRAQDQAHEAAWLVTAHVDAQHGALWMSTTLSVLESVLPKLWETPKSGVMATI